MVIIRRARKEDIGRICEVNIRAFGAGPFLTAMLMEERHGVMRGKSWKTHMQEREREFCEKHIDDVFVAEQDGKVVGLVEITSNEKNKTGEIRNNAVDPEYQGKGISTKLVTRGIEELKDKGARIITVHTLETARAAQRVYEKVGLKELARGITYTMEV